MTDTELKRLNRILGDRMGYLPSGESAFKWMHSRDLLFPYVTHTRRVQQDGALLSTVQDVPVCEMVRQCKRDVWLLAKWCAPPPKQEWEQRYGDVLGYPENGYWFMVTPLRPGAEPDEEFCALVADQLNWQRELDFQTTMNLIMAQEERERKRDKAVSDALIDDVFVNHVPGARGGSYSAPLTKFDR